MADQAEAISRNSLYDVDFFEWTQEQARLLREGRWQDLDLGNLVDEVESVGSSSKDAIESPLVVLIAHLLKWMVQPTWRSAGWIATIFEQRYRIAQIARKSPSLRSYPADVFHDQYRAARLLAAKETGIAYAIFPDACPFTIGQVLDDDFLPREPGNIGSAP